MAGYMDGSLTRRTLTRLMTAGGVAFAAGRATHLTAATQESGIASGGIGLTKTAFEAYFGPGEATQSYGKYIDPTYGGPIYVGFDFVNHPDGLLDFLELQWSGVSQAGGLSESTAAYEVSTVLPADAVIRKRYWMGATPGGPIALRSEEWTSASLAGLRGGKGSILVTYQVKTGSLNPGSPMQEIITAATIAAEE